MKFLIVTVSLISSLAFADHPQQVGKPVVEAVQTLLSQRVPVIDVRQEACDGYVVGAHLVSIEEFLNHPESAVNKVLKLVNSDKNKDVAVYCRSGARAAKVINVLKEFGFTNLHNLGGLGDYYDAATMQKCAR